jgi:hypothetical protein
MLGRVELKGDPDGAVALQKQFKLSSLGKPTIAKPPAIQDFDNKDLIGAEIFDDVDANRRVAENRHRAEASCWRVGIELVAGASVQALLVDIPDLRAQGDRQARMGSSRANSGQVNRPVDDKPLVSETREDAQLDVPERHTESSSVLPVSEAEVCVTC